MSDVIELTGPALARAVLERRAATCGTCGRSWDDTISTSMTPVPSGRCPFEYEHAPSCAKCGDTINDLSEYPDRNDIDVCWNCDRGFCEQVPTNTDTKPLQYHYVVWAEIVDGEIKWRIDIEGDNLLHDGSVYDPNAKRGEEWRRLFDDEIYGLDSRLFLDLCDRLDVK
jgi:hypothetical protein